MSPIPTSVAKLNEYLGLTEHSQKRWQSKANLNLKQRQIVLCHISGMPVADICEKVRTSPTYIYKTIRSQAAQQVIDDFLTFSDQEFKALYQLSIQAIRDALTCDDVKIRLQAAEKYLKAHGKYGDTGNTAGATAEDVIRRIFEAKLTLTEETVVNRSPTDSGGKELGGKESDRSKPSLPHTSNLKLIEGDKSNA